MTVFEPFVVCSIFADSATTLAVRKNYVERMPFNAVSPLTAMAVVMALLNRIADIVDLRSDENMVRIHAKGSIATMECLKRAI